MPGIAGVVGFRDEKTARQQVVAMIAAMTHDPSYEQGMIVDADQAVCAGWTAHPNTYASTQSGQRKGLGISAAFCGEVYDVNGMPAAGEPPVCDLVPEGERFGPDHVRRLNGLFSGFVLDSVSGNAFLFCDRFPMERLYVYEEDGKVFFASEIKALLYILPKLRELDEAGVAQFLAFGCTFGEQTLFKSVRRLPGASIWHFRNGRTVSRSVYFEPAEWRDQPLLSEPAFEEEFVSLFRKIVPRYVTGARKLGVSITGGLDTRMIMACMPPLDPSPPCYTYAGLTGETLDVRLGRRVATVCGLEHTAIPIGSDFLTDYQGYLDRTVYVTDGSAGPLGTHEIYYSTLARQHSLVRLTGNYGSEILRSMSTLKPARRPPGFLSVADEDLLAAARISETGEESVTQSAFREIPWHLFGTLSACRSLQVFRTPYLDNELVRLACRAPESARNSPNAALKLIQACDPRLARIPTDRWLKAGDGKAMGLLKRAGTALSFKLDYLDKEGLPGKLRAMDPVLDAMARLGLLGRHKFLPYRRWFRKELRPVLRQGIERARDDNLPWIDAANLDVVDSEHSTGRVNHLSQINAILSLEAVNRLLVRGEGFGTISKAETHGPDGP